MEKQRPCVIIECRLSDLALSPHLLAFQEMLDVPYAIQLISQPGYARRTTLGGRTQWSVSADRWLGTLA